MFQILTTQRVRGMTVFNVIVLQCLRYLLMLLACLSEGRRLMRYVQCFREPSPEVLPWLIDTVSRSAAAWSTVLMFHSNGRCSVDTVFYACVVQLCVSCCCKFPVLFHHFNLLVLTMPEWDLAVRLALLQALPLVPCFIL